jgi:ribokinase
VVVVFGSINLDLVSRVERFPAPGETLAGSSFVTYPGGKGANQALAAARAGARVRLYGAVGRDAFADAAMRLLLAGGVDLRDVARVDAPTGCATIFVTATGENCIVVVAGASQHADPASVPDSLLTREAVLVLQQEVPAAANEALIRRAHANGARIVLNAAPARPISLDVLRRLDVLIVNEDEAAALAAPLGWPGAPSEFAAAAAANAAGTRIIIVTLGANGALCRLGAETLHVAAPPVDVVDTTGAGDAFVGALAAALDQGSEASSASRRAVAAGSLACTARGAQPALPDRAAIEALLPSVTLRRT